MDKHYILSIVVSLNAIFNFIFFVAIFILATNWDKLTIPGTGYITRVKHQFWWTFGFLALAIIFIPNTETLKVFLNIQ